MYNIYYSTKSDGYLASLSYLKNNFKQFKRFWPKFLFSQDTYTSTRQVVRKFNRRKYIVSQINKSFQADVMFLDCILDKKVSSYNDNVTALLVLVDMLSKFTYVYTLKNKNANSVASKLKSFLVKMGKTGSYVKDIMTDMGSEFYNKTVKALFKTFNVNHYSSLNYDIKAGVAERKIRQIRSKIMRYITSSEQLNYVDKLDDIVQSINDTKNRTTGLAPSEITEWHTPYLFNILHRENTKFPQKSKYSLNQLVKITRPYKTFEKESNNYKFASEIFSISKIQKNPPYTYILEDLDKNPILGSFYDKELQPVTISTKKHPFKIIKSEGNNIFIHFTSYPKTLDRWVHRKSILT